MTYSKVFFPIIAEIFRVSVALSRSLQLAFRYRQMLRIREEELLEYFRKSVHFALYFQGFGEGMSFREAEGAGRVAFLGCAYDVVTDWRNYDAKWFRIFKQIGRAEANRKLAAMALDLYRKDSAGTLASDGLERGIIAFHSILEVMGLTNRFKQKANIDDLGLMLQLVDDVIDYEIDSRNGDQNCINSPHGRYYLCRLIAEMSDEQVRLLFPESRILLHVIRRSRRKAHKLLKEITDGENTKHSPRKAF